MPEDIIKFNEVYRFASKHRQLSYMRRARDVLNGTSFSPVIVGRLPSGDNVVLALDSKALRYHGRWIDSVWKSRSYADALKENPINLYIF